MEVHDDPSTKRTCKVADPVGNDESMTHTNLIDEKKCLDSEDIIRAYSMTSIEDPWGGACVATCLCNTPTDNLPSI